MARSTMCKAGKSDFNDGVNVTKEKYAAAHGDYRMGFNRQMQSALRRHGLVKIADLRLNRPFAVTKTVRIGK